MKIRISFRSLFFKLMLGFLVVMILLISTNLVSMYVLKEKMHSEVLKYNAFNMKDTVSRFEKQWDDMLQLTLSVLWPGKILETIAVFDVLALRFLISSLVIITLAQLKIIKVSFKGKPHPIIAAGCGV